MDLYHPYCVPTHSPSGSPCSPSSPCSHDPGPHILPHWILCCHLLALRPAIHCPELSPGIWNRVWYLKWGWTWPEGDIPPLLTVDPTITDSRGDGFLVIQSLDWDIWAGSGQRSLGPPSPASTALFYPPSAAAVGLTWSWGELWLKRVIVNRDAR